MTESTPASVERLANTYKEVAGRLADHFTAQAALRNDMEVAATEAESAGLADFEGMFRDLVARLGGTSTYDGKAAPSPARRRGRPPKSDDNDAASV